MNIIRPLLVAVLGFVLASLPALQASSNFADPQLEKAVRAALNKPVDDLTTTDILKLTSLQASSYQINDLCGLEQAANLTELQLAMNHIANVAVLARLERLEYLSLAYNHISDPSALRQLVNLHYLDLRGNPISDASPLCALTNLMVLDLGELLITNGNCVVCFTHLHRLALNSNRITNITPLLSLTNLQSLNLSDNPVTDWHPLASFTNLLSLSVGGASLSNLDWLTELRDLTDLSLNRNSVSDLSPLTALTNLSNLEISQNPITNYAALACIPNLKLLSAQGNSINDISFVTSLPELLALNLTGNYIADLAALAGLTKLASMQADFNLVADISVLRDLTNLQSISLTQNLLDLAMDSKATVIIQTLQSNGVSVNYQPQLSPPQMLVRTHWLLAAGQKSWLPIFSSDAASFWLQPFTLAAHSSNQGILPDSGLRVSHADDSYFWNLAVTPAKDQTGTATLTLAATNYAGLWSNTEMQIRVVQPIPFPGESLDCSNLSWSTAGDPSWRGETSFSHDGIGAAQSGAQDSWLQTTVSGPGTLRFWWKLESDYFYANSQFSAVSLDSNLHGWQYLHRGGEAWQQALMGLPAGNWLLHWSPSWDDWSYGGANTLWLDQVSFITNTPGCWIEPKFYDLPTRERVFTFHGVLGQSYDVEFSNDLLSWSWIARVQCFNFETEFRDWKQVAAARFYRAVAVP